MTTVPTDAPVSATSVDAEPAQAPPTCYALLGNPNTGKTTLFNRLCGIRAQTANFPGSTVEARMGGITCGRRACRLVDLPGIYGLNLKRPESEVCKAYLAGDIAMGRRPQAVIVVADATNLKRNLIFISQAIQQGLPAVIALNMTDLAARAGIEIDVAELERHIGCTVVPVSARSGAGLSDLNAALDKPAPSTAVLPDPCDAHAAAMWADQVFRACVTDDARRSAASERLTDRLDALFTHPLLGLIAFTLIMTGLFYAIFSLASIPMDLIELTFSSIGGLIGATVPEGAVRDLLADGVIGGISGTVVFLPQICLLFFMISLLEDTGYLARAAFVLDRVMRRFGMPGQAFVPLLSAHACAIPAILSTRLIPDRRDRLATVLVAPFMSCSARLPVYVLLVGILFPDNALHAGLAFSGCYVLGAAAAFFSALLVRRSLLRGASSPMVIELPTYKLPSLRTALLTMVDRGWLFLRKIGTVILAICIILWWLSAYPKTEETAGITAMRTEAETLMATDPAQAEEMIARADSAASRHALAESFAGRIGRTVAPVFKPIGLDWQLTIGVITSFAAREVFVSTMAVLFAGADETDDIGVRQRIQMAVHDDGSPVFTMRTAASLLVFFVLAMQCLPTLAVTARETGHWGWALLQLMYMSSLAYAASLIMYHGLGLLGVA